MLVGIANTRNQPYIHNKGGRVANTNKGKMGFSSLNASYKLAELLRHELAWHKATPQTRASGGEGIKFSFILMRQIMDTQVEEIRYTE